MPKQTRYAVRTDLRKCGLAEEKNTTLEATCSLWIFVLILVVNLEGRRLLGKHRPKWEYNIKMDLQEFRCRVKDWIELVQGGDRWRALVIAVMNFRVP